MDIMETARQFARALDGDDFDAAMPALAEDCVYHTGKEVLRGPEAVLNSYRTQSEQARKQLDKLAYRSITESEGDDRARITYIDLITHNGVSHDYRCQQVLTFNREERIARIDHVELEGQRESLHAFHRKVGLA